MSINCSLNNLQIKAIGPDNERVIRKIIDLFSACYKDSFPIAGVYDLQFWKSHIGLRFSSLVAFHDGEPIAHIALAPGPENRSHVQLSLPVCHRDYLEHRTFLEMKLLEVLETQRQRQDWRMLYFFVLANLPRFSEFAAGTIKTRVTAICPSYFPAIRSDYARADQRDRTDVIVTKRVFDAVKEDERLCFVPEYHQDICSRLYSALGLSRRFIESSEVEAFSPSAPLSASATLSSDAPALQTSFFGRTGVCHAFIQPSLIRSVKDALAEIDAALSANKYVFVNTEDRACPAFCDALENHGYRFCGILPLMQGTDNLVYTNSIDSSFDVNSFITPRARNLAEYISQYTLSRSSNQAVLSETFTSTRAVQLDPLPDILVP